MIEEVVASDLPGLIFRYVWAFDLPEDEQAVRRSRTHSAAVAARVLFLELEATQEERLRRNEGTSRLAEKPSKRDVSASRRNVLDWDRQYQLNSSGQFDDRADYLRIDNTDLTPVQAAMVAITHFHLHWQPGRDVPPVGTRRST